MECAARLIASTTAVQPRILESALKAAASNTSTRASTWVAAHRPHLLLKSQAAPGRDGLPARGGLPGSDAAGLVRERIERLLAVAEAQPTAILCSEEDPSQCHRTPDRPLSDGGHPDVSVQHPRDGAVFGANAILKIG